MYICFSVIDCFRKKKQHVTVLEIIEVCGDVLNRYIWSAKKRDTEILLRIL